MRKDRDHFRQRNPTASLIDVEQNIVGVEIVTLVLGVDLEAHLSPEGAGSEHPQQEDLLLILC